MLAETSNWTLPEGDMNLRAILICVSTAAVTAGAAAAAEKTYDIANFAAVGVSAGIEAEIRVGGDYSVKAVGDQQELDELRVEKKGDGLEIGRKPMKFSWGRKRGEVKVFVTLPALKALDVSSGASADASGVDADSFAVEASSGAQATIAGACGALAADVSSGGDIEADALKCKSGAAEASSGGAMDVFVSDSIVAEASSGGSIRVHGTPKNVSIEKSSGGSVRVAE